MRVPRLGEAVEPAEVELLTEADFAANPFLVKGYIGPKGLQDNGVRYLVDPRVGEGTSWITGANLDQKHAHSVVAGRDFFADGVVEVARTGVAAISRGGFVS